MRRSRVRFPSAPQGLKVTARIVGWTSRSRCPPNDPITPTVRALLRPGSAKVGPDADRRHSVECTYGLRLAGPGSNTRAIVSGVQASRCGDGRRGVPGAGPLARLHFATLTHAQPL